jgi:hypothetical protein
VDAKHGDGDGRASSITGIFIKNVLEGSPAGMSGQLATGDRILEVDGHDLRSASHDEAVDVIRQSGQVISFLVQSLVAANVSATASNATGSVEEEEGDSTEDMSESLAAARPVVPPPEFANDSCPSSCSGSETDSPTGSASEEEDEVDNSSTPSVPLELGSSGPTTSGDSSQPPAGVGPSTRIEKRHSLETGTDESDFAELSGSVTLSNGNEIDRNSAGFLPLSKKDKEEPDDYGYTNMKIQRKYAKFSHQPDGSRGELIYASINKGTGGLGISLAGHKDRSKMSVYLCGLNPQGNAYRDGRMRVGDLVLEVNGKVLHDRHHLNVTSLIKVSCYKLFLIQKKAFPPKYMDIFFPVEPPRIGRDVRALAH